MSDRLDAAAEWIAASRLGRRPVSAMPAALRPRDANEGYDIQRGAARLLAQRGRGAVVGWKVGATTPAMQNLLKLSEPIAGTVFEAGVLRSPARVRHADFHKLGVECEVCVRLARPLPAGKEKVDRAAAAAAIGAVMPAMELVDNRYGDFTAIGAPVIVADDAFQAAIVLGAEVANWRAVDLAASTGETLAGGKVAQRGKGADVLGHPFESVAWLANLFAARGERLEAGHYVMTGSLPLPHWAAPGEDVVARIEGLGEVKLRVD